MLHPVVSTCHHTAGGACLHVNTGLSRVRHVVDSFLTRAGLFANIIPKVKFSSLLTVVFKLLVRIYVLNLSERLCVREVPIFSRLYKFIAAVCCLVRGCEVKSVVSLVHARKVYEGPRGVALFIVNLGVKMKVSGQHHVSPALPTCKNPDTSWRLGRLQSRSGRFEVDKKKICCPCRNWKPRSFSR